MKTKPSVRRLMTLLLLNGIFLIGGTANAMSDNKAYTEQALQKIKYFGDHYNYNVGYLEKLLKETPDGMRAYESFTAMGQFKGSLSNEVYFVASLASIYTEDCGDCVQLNIKMALEAGVSEEVVRGALQMGGSLPEALELVRKFSQEVASNSVSDDVHAKMLESYGDQVIAELSLCIAANRVYPAMKRALGFAGKSCKIMDFDFSPNS
jgi:alkylhydroperoxidase/carboxymuconolactone decarboxylase family protein YurZ